MAYKVDYVDLFLQEHGALQKELDQAITPQEKYYIAAEVGNKILKVSVDRIAYLKTFAKYAEEEVGNFLTEYNILGVQHPLQGVHYFLTCIDFHEGPAIVVEQTNGKKIDEETAIVYFLECALQEIINLHE